MSYSERNLTSDFSKYLRKDPASEVLSFTFAIEFKLKKGKQRLDFIKDFQPQQIPSLLKANNGCVYHKISDQGMNMKPFDSFQICDSRAFVGVMWHKPRKPKMLYLLNVDLVQEFIGNKCYKINEEDAANNAVFIIRL